MKTNINGRLRKFSLKTSEGLIPVQEAIVNSIQANATDIKIEIIREDLTQQKISSLKSISKIKAFQIIDNGIGLNNENFSSFEELDSEYKLEIGGKGIGRISYLKVFDNVRVESIYEENGKKYLRKFNFKNTNKGIEDLEEKILNDDISVKTIVSLMDFKENFRKDTLKKTEEIARSLLLYLLIYFINSDSNLDITIIDKSTDQNISLKEIFSNEFKEKIKEKELIIKNEKFLLKHFLLDVKTNGKEENEISYVAHNRKVYSEKIKKYDGLLKGPFENKYLVVYISGEYFDENINDERTDFTFAKTSKIEERLFITLEDIVTEVLEFIKKEYDKEYSQLLEINKKILNDYIKENPQYRYLYASNQDIITKINSDMPLDKIDNLFYNIKRDIQKNINNKVCRYNKINQEEKEEILKMISDVEKTSVIEYIINRKLVLELLEKSLEIDENGKYKKEDFVHNIFFPTKKDSNEIEYEEHNLWLIDDRLSFHNYAFSDESILKKEEEKGYKRPDILVYNKPNLIKDTLHSEEECFYIVEFKRPQRDDYSTGENPIDQVLNYAIDIREQRLKIKGRTVKPNDNALIYAFVICDITQSLTSRANRYQMSKTPDGESYYGYFKEEKVFLEIYSFDKVLDNAKKRNRIFFEKLGID